VAYFRAFTDSDTPLAASKDVYTDLAMSQKGVCRHRAYAFTITALALGIPTRMVMNEAHAWVEVSDGRLWHRIDLGGAGRMQSEEAHTAEPYTAPTDAFPWPANATRGEDMMEKATNINGGGGSSGSAHPAPSSTATQPHSKVTLDVKEPDVARGRAIHVTGTVTAESEPCQGTLVTVFVRDAQAKREARIGSVIVDDKGAFAGAIVIPSTVAVGDYDVVARVEGDKRCGAGASQ
jgi:hypothetical protein